VKVPSPLSAVQVAWSLTTAGAGAAAASGAALSIAQDSKAAKPETWATAEAFLMDLAPDFQP
jgi:hypothetical protein